MYKKPRAKVSKFKSKISDPVHITFYPVIDKIKILSYKVSNYSLYKI